MCPKRGWLRVSPKDVARSCAVPREQRGRSSSRRACSHWPTALADTAVARHHAMNEATSSPASLLTALIQATGDKAQATQLLRKTLALALGTDIQVLEVEAVYVEGEETSTLVASHASSQPSQPFPAAGATSMAPAPSPSHPPFKSSILNPDAGSATSGASFKSSASSSHSSHSSHADTGAVASAPAHSVPALLLGESPAMAPAAAAPAPDGAHGHRKSLLSSAAHFITHIASPRGSASPRATPSELRWQPSSPRATISAPTTPIHARRTLQREGTAVGGMPVISIPTGGSAHGPYFSASSSAHGGRMQSPLSAHGGEAANASSHGGSSYGGSSHAGNSFTYKRKSRRWSEPSQPVRAAGASNHAVLDYCHAHCLAPSVCSVPPAAHAPYANDALRSRASTGLGRHQRGDGTACRLHAQHAQHG